MSLVAELIDILRKKYVVASLFVAAASFLFAECEMPFQGQERKVELRFAVAADGHWGQPGTDYEGNHRQLIEAINRLHDTAPFDFVVLVGDLVHDRPDLLPEVKSRFDQLVPDYYVVHGNHDHATPELWKKIWGLEINVTVTVKNHHLLLVNTADSIGTYTSADAAWLQSAVERAHPDPVFVFAHITQKAWTRHGIGSPEVMTILTANDAIRAVFHGHDHDVDEIRMEDGIPFVFTGRFGGSWGGRRQFVIAETDAEKGITIYRCDLETGLMKKQQRIQTRVSE